MRLAKIIDNKGEDNYSLSNIALNVLLISTTISIGIMATTNQAQAITFTGDTTGEPTWNRPIAPGFSTLSGVGTAVRYDVFNFTVDTTGAYNFLSTGTNPSSWDNYTFLYGNSFNPNSQFTNGIIGNDDFPGVGVSGFNGVNLTAGVQYFFVTTGFNNSDFGAYTNSITGVGNVNPTVADVPEPTTILGSALMLGFGAIFKKKQKNQCQNVDNA